MSISLFYYIIWSMYLRMVFLWCSEKSNFKQTNSTIVEQKNIESSRKEYVTGTCFKFWPMADLFRHHIVCLSGPYSNILKAVLHKFYLVYSWILCPKHSSMRTSCHMKPKCFLWTKLLENLLLAKYLTSVAAT